MGLGPQWHHTPHLRLHLHLNMVPRRSDGQTDHTTSASCSDRPLADASRLTATLEPLPPLSRTTLPKVALIRPLHCLRTVSLAY